MNHRQGLLMSQTAQAGRFARLAGGAVIASLALVAGAASAQQAATTFPVGDQRVDAELPAEARTVRGERVEVEMSRTMSLTEVQARASMLNVRRERL